MYVTPSAQRECAAPLMLPASRLSATLSSNSSVARSNSPRLPTAIANALRRLDAVLSPLLVRKRSTPSTSRPSSPAPIARSRSPCRSASQETLYSALARAALGAGLDFASASSSHLSPSAKCPCQYQNSPSAAPTRSAISASSPCPSDQESAALMLSCSSSSRSSHIGCRDPSTSGSASSAREEVLGVKPPQLLGLLALLELLAGEFVDGLKH